MTVEYAMDSETESQGEVSLTIRAAFDDEQEAVGLVAEASEGFDDGQDMRAKVEILAAISAKANCIAAEIIRSWDTDENHRKQLYDHFAFLKEQMLTDMLQRIDESQGPTE